MLWFVFACFVVGCIVIMLFTEEGRGCLGGFIAIIIILVGITILGGLVLVGGFYLLLELSAKDQEFDGAKRGLNFPIAPSVENPKFQPEEAANLVAPPSDKTQLKPEGTVNPSFFVHKVVSKLEEIGLRNSEVEETYPRVYAFSEGERLEFDLVGADYDAVYYIDYYDADGNVLHLQPNEKLPLEMVDAQSELIIGADRQGRPSPEFIVAPPFGQEIMVAMATSQPLYDGLRPIIEPAEPYLAFMRERVTETRARHGDFKGEWVYFLVNTHPRK